MNRDSMSFRPEQEAALAQLGKVMQAIGAGYDWPGHAIGLAEHEYHRIDEAVRKAHQHNGWFTSEQVRFAFTAWGAALNAEALSAWAARYPDAPRTGPARTVGLILAGNVPLVGLHDVLCVWLAGHQARVKGSSQEPELVPSLMQVLDQLAPEAAGRIVFETGKLGEVEALIATGSSNTARYFEHYFGHLPRIVRGTRVSLAVLDGTESPAELTALGEDVFRYFGLGCRNVSKVLVPADFDVQRLFAAFYPWSAIVQHGKYGNNYDYTRALWLLDRVDFLENGFLLVKEDKALASPVSALFVERYASPAEADAIIAAAAPRVQCVVGHGRPVAFGQAQHPALWDYADGVDTLRFLLDLP
jgi:hypothetical protein